MSDETPYAIGSADSIGIVVPTGVWQIEYDLKQAQEEGHVKFDIIEHDQDELFETDNLALGDNMTVEVAREAMDILGPETVYGFVVPDYQLATFIQQFPDREVFRHR